MSPRRLGALGLLILMTSQSLPAPPRTEKVAVTDEYHGEQIVDDYRWLEDWEAAKVKAWSAAQNEYARSVLDDLPHVDAIRRRVTTVMSAKSIGYGGLAKRGNQYFVIKREPPKQQPFLIVVPSLSSTDGARVLLDPNELDKEGTTSIDWFTPSPNGKLVAVSISDGGDEIGDVHVYDVATGEEVHEVVPSVNSGTAGGDLAWAPDSSGFYYTRHPRPGERPKEDLGFFQQLYFHQLGTATADDRFELGEGFSRIAEIEIETHANGTAIATVQKGDGGEFKHYFRDVQGKWTQFSRYGDKTVQATFQPNGNLLLISRDGAPRGKILSLAADDLDLNHAGLLIPESDATVVTSFYHSPPSLFATKSRIFVLYQLGGPSELRVFDHDGKRVDGPQQLPISSVGGLVGLGDDEIAFVNTSYVQPPAYYRFDAATGESAKTALATESTVSFDDIEVVREYATSKDGTQVPLNIIRKKGTASDRQDQAGPRPTLLNGYGGYGLNITPGFRASRKVILEQGVVFVVANIRGGGEFGEAWHLDGNLTKKQNVFDDFAAAARHLITKGYTTSDKLAIIGGSNGGLLMGATMTQNPKLARCVISSVGIYDMLRVELSTNGAFNIPEFGSVKDLEQYRALRAYSPFHNVKDGTEYPATLFLTGANDPRVDPMQSRKMTARLQAAQAANPKGMPILLRTSSNSGHGGDTALSEQIEQRVDMDAFLFKHLGVEYQSP